MTDMLEFDAPKQRASIIKVLGVGGGGSNAVTHMFQQGITGVDFIICNTDAQAMDTSPIPNKIQLGDGGLGAGAIPDVGRQAAEDKTDDIKSILGANTKMLFITAGMGGGTGTGAAPVIARIAREMDILTVAIVTIPFTFEGRKRRLQAEKGIEELKKHVDTLLIISNEKLREIHGNLKLSEAFGQADDILTTAAKGIAEIITVTGYINVDFQDVKTVMRDSGTAIMGSASAEGEDRARVAVREALSSPLLNDNKITGASDILLYISSGKEEITFDEVGEITDFIQEESGLTAEVIWGNGYDESLGDKISITLIATGFKAPEEIEQNTLNQEPKRTIHTLDGKPPTNNYKEEPKAQRPVAAEPKPIDLEGEEITEITLIKKDKSKLPEDSDRQENKSAGIPSLFDQPATPTAEKPSSSPAQPQWKKPTSSDQTPKNSNANNLRIGHTVGSFDYSSSQDENNLQQNQFMQKKADSRIQKLKEMNFTNTNANSYNEDLEKVPAYVRKKVALKSVMPSSESNVARWVLGEDDEKNPEIQSNDIPFIKDKPD